MSIPTTVSTDIGSILCFVSGTTGRAFLTGIGRVYLFNLDAKSFCLVGDEHAQLVEAPIILHAVVFAGRCPTTFACRVLAYALQGFNLDRSHTLLRGMTDDLARKLMIDSLHPSPFFALTLLDSPSLLGFL